MGSNAGVRAGVLAITLSIVALIGLVFITLFYSVGGPFGTLNDVCVALEGILSVALIWGLSSMHMGGTGRWGVAALWIGSIGGILAAIGSGLVVSDVTGWFLAGLVTTFGYACIGVWLLGLNYEALHRPELPRPLAQFGIVTGWLMTGGLLVAPGILAGNDQADFALSFPMVVLVVSGLAWNLLYPLWTLWAGRRLLARGRSAHPPVDGAGRTGDNR